MVGKVKFEIKKYSINYCKILQRVKRAKENEIRRSLKEELNQRSKCAKSG